MRAKRKGRVADIDSPWMRIRVALGEIVAAAGLTPDDALVKHAMADLEASFRDLQVRVRMAKKHAVAKRSVIVDACRVLGLRLPKLGTPVNIRIAYRNRGRKLRSHHSDIAVGDMEMHKLMFQQILDAYDILVAYNESFVRVDVPASTTDIIDQVFAETENTPEVQNG
jgi:hypothetical protein